MLDAVKSLLLLWHRPESSGEAGGDPGDATEGSELYQNGEGENSDITSRGATSDPAVTAAFSRPADSAPDQTQAGDTEDAEAAEGNPEDPRSADTAHTHAHTQREIASAPNLRCMDMLQPVVLTGPSLCLLRHPGITSGLMKGALSVAASAYKALFTGQGPTQVSSRAVSVLCRFSQFAHDAALFSAASRGRIHPGHHDGRAGGDGLRGPAPEPAPAEQIQLQPAGRCQRARSDERQ